MSVYGEFSTDCHDPSMLQMLNTGITETVGGTVGRQVFFSNSGVVQECFIPGAFHMFSGDFMDVFVVSRCLRGVPEACRVFKGFQVVPREFTGF